MSGKLTVVNKPNRLKVCYAELKGEPKMNRWTEFFIKLAKLYATQSKDPSTKVGCVIVKDKIPISWGYNGLPKGLKDTPERLSNRTLKLKLTKHAEENAILFGRKEDLKDATLYVTNPPCSLCAGDMIQVGIAKVVYLPGSIDFQERYKEDSALAIEILEEVGIVTMRVNQ